MTILAPTSPRPAFGKLKVHVEAMTDACVELVRQFEQQTPTEWHPAEIEYLFRVVLANHLIAKGQPCPPTMSPPPSTLPSATSKPTKSKGSGASSRATSRSEEKRRRRSGKTRR